MIRTRLVITAALAALATATAAPSAFAPAAAGARPATPPAAAAAPAVPTTPDELLEWARTHPRQSAIVVLRAGDRTPVISLGAHRRMPLASTRKVLILLAASEQVTTGRLRLTDRVPQAALDRWYLPGTDGGAHPAALAAYGDDWTVETALRAMIVQSDNAAADWVLDRVGGPRVVDRLTRRLGLHDQDPIWSLRGEFLAWSSHPVRWLHSAPVQRQRLATRLAAASRGPVDVALPTVRAQRRLALASVRGSMADWAQLMRRIDEGARAGDAAFELAERVLSWPLEDPANAEVLDFFATKGGALAGVVTEATAIRARGGRTLYVAQAYRALPPAVEEELRTRFLQQLLYVRLALGERGAAGGVPGEEAG
ncbi:serine hydrolase [Nocardioides sp.]|uniref:serine hydrolase n=1 Tax=Nocardioides sp. TaxID=35761 RepID=UPI003514C49C